MKKILFAIVSTASTLLAIPALASSTGSGPTLPIRFVPVFLNGDYLYQQAATNYSTLTTNTYISNSGGGQFPGWNPFGFGFYTSQKSKNKGTPQTNTTITATTVSAASVKDKHFKLSDYVSLLDANLGLGAPTNSHLVVDLSSGDFWLQSGTNFSYDLTANGLLSATSLGVVDGYQQSSTVQNQFLNGAPNGGSTNANYNYSVTGVSQLVINTSTNAAGNIQLNLSAGYTWGESIGAQNGATTGFGQASFQAYIFGTVSQYDGTAYQPIGLFTGGLEGQAWTNSAAY
jgi:hypothetical protein